MPVSLADVDLTRLTPEALATLQDVALPISDGADPRELAAHLDVTLAELEQKLEALADELHALAKTPPGDVQECPPPPA